MGYLYVYVKPAHLTADQQLASIPPLFETHARAALAEHSVVGPGWTKLTALLDKGGYEIRPHFGSYDPHEWPYTAVAYTSPNKEGKGRSGSSLYRFPCRKKP